MQGVNGLIARVHRRGRGHGAGSRPSQTDLFWGLAGILCVLVLVVAFAVAYAVKIGVATYSAELPDAGAVRVGDDVRVAGISVGEVKSLVIAPDHVAMTFTVDSDVFLGAQSTIDVRMLTIVGGHYLALFPAGSEPLGATPIPADRVVLPYNLTQVFQDALKPVQEIDGDTLRRSLGALEKGIDGSPEAFGSAVTAVESVVDVLNKQNADVSKTLSIADEYLSSLNGAKEVLGRLVNSINLLETIVHDNKARVVPVLDKLAATLQALAPLGRMWEGGLEPRARALTEAMSTLGALDAELGKLLDAVHGFSDQVGPLVANTGGLAVDQSGTTIVAPGVCVPVPGRNC